jgi:hypothetical protein
VVPLPGICGFHFGNKIRMGMQDIEHIDDLPAAALFFRGYVENFGFR